MDAEPDLDRLARTIGDATRMKMLVLLMDGGALTAKELAYGAGVEPATASVHLGRLTGDRLLVGVSQGRHKYFRLASPAVASLVESFMVLAARKVRARDGALEAIRVARYCYDHVAGRLGTRLTEALVTKRILKAGTGGFEISASGERWLSGFGVDLAAVRRRRRSLAPRCLDWSERRDHVAGSLGAALADQLVSHGWIERQRDSRVVDVTPSGRRGLMRELGVSLIGA